MQLLEEAQCIGCSIVRAGKSIVAAIRDDKSSDKEGHATPAVCLQQVGGCAMWSKKNVLLISDTKGHSIVKIKLSAQAAMSHVAGNGAPGATCDGSVCGCVGSVCGCCSEVSQ